MGKESARQLQGFVESAQSLVLALKVLDALCIGRAQALAHLRHRCRPRGAGSSPVTSVARSQSLAQWTPPQPTARGIPIDAPAPCAWPARGSEVRTCLTCSWPHVLKRWSFLKSPGRFRSRNIWLPEMGCSRCKASMRCIGRRSASETLRGVYTRCRATDRATASGV